MKQRNLIIIALGIITLFSLNTINTSYAQDNAQCPEVVPQAIEITNQVCTGLGENQACYGNILVEAEAYSDFSPLTFNQPGDIADLLYIQSLQLSPLNMIEETWGMARFEVLANLFRQDFDTVTLLLFGDTTISNGVRPTTPAEITINAADTVNVRLTPSTDGFVVGALNPGDATKALARLDDSSWLRVQLPDGGVGWVYSALIETEEDIQSLRVETFGEPYYEPMQAFYLHTDDSEIENLCNNAPPSGMIIQTPEGMGEITFLINEVTVDIGSTVYFDAPVGGPLSITTVEGQARVTANGLSATAYAGTTVTVPMTEDATPAGPPSAPVPYDLALVASLPLAGLDVIIAVMDPLSEFEISQLIARDVEQANISNQASTAGSPSAGDSGGNPAAPPAVPGQPDPGEPEPGQPDPPGAGGDEMVTICHIPPGNPANARTLVVSMESWLNAHSQHGDTLGPCP